MDLLSTDHLFDVRAYVFALFTLMSGAGLGNVIEDVPDGIKDMFKHWLFRAAVIMMMLIQSGQTLVVSAISTAAFLGIIYLWNRYEKYRSFHQRFEHPVEEKFI